MSNLNRDPRGLGDEALPHRDTSNRTRGERTYRGGLVNDGTNAPRLTARRVRFTARNQELMRRALELLVDGKSNREAAQVLGINVEKMMRLVDAALLQRDDELDEYVKRARKITLERLNVAIQSLMPQVRQGKLHAIKILVELEERVAKLLGLDAPEQVDHRHLVATVESDDELVQRAAAFGIFLGTLTQPPALGPRVVGRESLVQASEGLGGGTGSEDSSSGPVLSDAPTPDPASVEPLTPRLNPE